MRVITSYSIHYTKLYDTDVLDLCVFQAVECPHGKLEILDRLVQIFVDRPLLQHRDLLRRLHFLVEIDEDR